MDTRYAEKVSKGASEQGATSILAMAIARDGENLFTAERLEQIRERMELAETIEVRWFGSTFLWTAVNWNYDFTHANPCGRDNTLATDRI